jgi:hypothetical protein
MELAALLLAAAWFDLGFYAGTIECGAWWKFQTDLEAVDRKW